MKRKYEDETKRPYDVLNERQIDRLGGIDNPSLRLRIEQDMLDENERIHNLGRE
tara:strand:- start:378 stop:539 length:162 start_codon:yes stop_codon:yes gene_type:complete